jgi:hypothetical protein
MMRRAFLILVLIAQAALAAGGGWALLQAPHDSATARPSLTRLPAEAELHAMRAQADEACRCARSSRPGPARSACWSGYEHNVGGFEHYEMVDMCLPLQSTLTCFGSGMNMEHCIERSRGDDACSDEEARILEGIFAEEQEHPTRGRDRWAEAVAAFIRHDSVPRPHHYGEGCSG